jgi:hypothetical protein
MKTIKSLIVSLSLVISLTFSGAYFVNVHAEEPSGPQDPRPSQQPPSIPPEIINIIISIIGSLLP